MALYKASNAGTRNIGRIVEHSGTVAEQRNTPEQPGIPTEQPGTTESYKTKNNCNDFKENLNLTLIHLTLSTQSGNIFNY